MNFNYKKVFITGSTGWLGKELLKTLLERNNRWINFQVDKSFEVTCLLNEIPDQEDKELFNSVRIVYGDLRNKLECEKFLYSMDSSSLLIHTAGIIHPSRTREFYEINVQGTQNILDIALQKSVNKIISISSNSPYGCNVNNLSFNEESAYNPYMSYGESKMKKEILLTKRMNEDTNISILCVPWFYGKGMPKRQVDFYKMISLGIFPIIGNGKNIRSLVNIDNIVQAIFLCATNLKSKNNKYWIADEENLTMVEIIETIKKVLENEFGIKTKKLLFKLPNFLGQAAEVFDKCLQSFGFYNQKIHVLSEINKNIFCNISKAQSELGYKPENDLYKGTFEAYKDFLDKQGNV